MHPQPGVRWGSEVCTPVFTAEAPESSGIPHAMVLRLMAYSPRRRIRLASVAGELTTCPRPVGPTCLRKLDTSNGCQDHTTLPSADQAPFVRVPSIAHGKPALRSRHTPNAAASTASRPAFVTIAIRPSMGRDGEGYRSDLCQAGTAIFFQKVV